MAVKNVNFAKLFWAKRRVALKRSVEFHLSTAFVPGRFGSYTNLDENANALPLELAKLTSFSNLHNSGSRKLDSGIHVRTVGQIQVWTTYMDTWTVK